MGTISKPCSTNSELEIKLLWTAYIGGGYGGTLPTCISIDRFDTLPSVYIGGFTYSSTFHYRPNGNAYLDQTGQGPASGGQGWVARFRQDGLLVWSTYFAEAPSAVISMDHDPQGRLVIAGSELAGIPDEQVTPPVGAEDYDPAGAGDAFIAMFNNDDQIMWSTLYGGSASDLANNVRCTNNTIVLGGNTSSDNMPSSPGPSGAYHEPFVGPDAAFIAEFNSSGALIWTTYLWGTGGDELGYRGLDISPGSNDIYLSGVSNGGALDIVPGTGWYDDTPLDRDGFIAQISGVDRSPLWLTYVNGGGGGYSYTYLTSIRVDNTLGICVGGLTTTFPMPYQLFPGVFSKEFIYPNVETSQPLEDAYYMRFSPTHELLHATYLGGASSLSRRDLGSAIQNDQVYGR
ncbi:MAG: hypothetical protein IPO90_07925 [Flavobacteriales bacterium]|nr:hypothetical protein [Flavobacteriales bacterium]